MTQLTKEETAVKDALYRFWFDHYTKPYTTAQRNQLVEDFASEWLDSSKIKMDKPVFYHPMNCLKRRYDETKRTAMDILADFIMRANMHEERRAEYSVTHAEQELTNADDRKELERSIFFQYEEDAMEEGERVPPYSIRESSIVLENSIEVTLFLETAPDVKKYREELKKVMEYPEFWATTLSEEYGYDKAEALREIKGLELDRVRECLICGNGFYAHDKRRHICDQQHGRDTKGNRTKHSACENIYQQEYNAKYYEKSIS